MTRCAAQDGFKQANGFLREAVAGKQVDVSERLRNESLCPFVKHRLARHSCQPGLHFRSGFSLRAHPGSRWLRKFGLQKLLGYHRARRQEPHLSEHAVKLALCRIAVRLAVEKLFKILLVCFKYALRESRGLVPIGILEIKIEQEFGLLAAFFEIGGLFKKLRGLNKIAL